ncbi:MAG: rod shape-determining protein MreC [Faecalibacterium sp.]
MDDFFGSAKFKFLVAVLIFLVAVMAYAGANGRLTAAPQEIFSVLLTPVQRVSVSISNGVSGFVDKYTNYDETVAENEVLRAENEALKEQLVEYDKLVAENEAYQELAGLQEENPETTYVLSFVIGRDSVDSFGGFTIDKGTLAGIEAGDTVISADGCLVGTVLEADLTSSKILTILHPSFSAAGMVSRTRDNGIIGGDSSYAAEGLCLFTNLSRDTLAAVDDVVITTGLGGVYPPDIRVGTIIELSADDSGKSSVAVIQPEVDVLTVKQVFVITDY